MSGGCTNGTFPPSSESGKILKCHFPPEVAGPHYSRSMKVAIILLGMAVSRAAQQA